MSELPTTTKTDEETLPEMIDRVIERERQEETVRHKLLRDKLAEIKRIKTELHQADERTSGLKTETYLRVIEVISGRKGALLNRLGKLENDDLVVIDAIESLMQKLEGINTSEQLQVIIDRAIRHGWVKVINNPKYPFGLITHASMEDTGKRRMKVDSFVNALIRKAGELGRRQAKAA